MNNINDKQRCSLFLTVMTTLLLCVSSQVKADDTEVFYTEGVKNNNVLFIMDNSGSMEEKVSGTVANGGSSFLTRSIAESNDDAEEDSNGDLKITDGDLEFGTKTFGLRFSRISIPKDATIVSAYIHFKTFSNSSSYGTSTLDIKVQSADNAPPFVGNISGNITNRSLYSIKVPWNPDSWDVSKEQGSKQKTPDIKTLVQEVVNRGSWTDGNSIVFVITGSGYRAASSYDTNDGKEAPILTIEYVTKGEKTRMQVMKDALRTVLQGAPKNISVGIMNYGDAIGDRVDSPNGVKFPISPIESLARPIVESSITVAGTPNWDLSNIPEPVNNIIVRAYLSEIVDDWKSTGFTPIVDSLYEAAKYFRGEEVHFGFGIANKELKYPAHPSTYNGDPMTETIDVGSCSSEPKDIQIWGLDNIAKWRDGSDTRKNICPASRTAPSGPGTAANCVKTEQNCNLKHQKCDGTWVDGTTVCSGSPDESGNPTNCTKSDGYCNGTLLPVGSNGYCHYATCVDSLLPPPKYTTPMKDRCQTNFMILMSDGKPELSSERKPASYDKIKTLMNGADCGTTAPSGFEAGYCGSELTHFLAGHDNSSKIDGDQFINTYVIGFSDGISDEAEKYLKSLVTIEDDINTKNKKEGYFNATSEAELTDAFTDALDAIAAETRSQASPGYSVNVKSGLEHEDDIYIPVFDKNNSSVWSGNLKKFKIVESGDHRYIRGKSSATGAPSTYINAMTELGLFEDTAWDIWSTSTVADGDEVAKGGAAGLLVSPSNRKLYSNIHSKILYEDANKIKTENDLLTTDMLNFDAVKLGLTTDAEKAAYRAKLIEFIRGWQGGVPSTTATPDIGKPRLHMGDMLHSEPVVITYKKSTKNKKKEQYIFAATNEGYLHAFDSTTGEEIFAFMPKELLGNIPTQFTSSGKHQYGIDGSLSFWHDDDNNDGEVDPAKDHVYLYFGMRRGGSSYYALDVTDPKKPILKWNIKGGEGQFAKLGQSWSLPYLAKVLDSDGASKAAVIFTAGNDTAFDQDVNYKADDVKTIPTATVGDDIYIVDAKDGHLLWSMESAGIDDVKHSIPGGARILDVNQNGLLDRLYFADTGGNVWRLDLLAEKLTKNADDFELTKIAILGESGGTNARRFYNEPDVSSMRVDGKTIFGISIGSGIRPHPMNEVVTDHMFMLLDKSPLSPISTYADTDYYPIKMTEPVSSDLSPVKIDVYTDKAGVVTKTVSKDSEFEGKKITQVKGKKGWYVKFKEGGEKVLAPAITFEGSLIFTTLVPKSLTQGVLVGACAIPATQGRIYALDVLTGEASINLDRSKDSAGKETINDNDAFLTIAAGEIPGTPQRIFNALKCKDGSCTHEVDVRIGKKGSEAAIKDVSDIESIYWSDPSR